MHRLERRVRQIRSTHASNTSRLINSRVGGDVMDINPSSVSDPLNLANTMPAQSANGNLVGSDKDSLQPPKEPRGGSVSQGNPSITYQVTINMVCTGAQLEAVMAGVAGAGTCVNMRIDPKT